MSTQAKARDLLLTGAWPLRAHTQGKGLVRFMYVRRGTLNFTASLSVSETAQDQQISNGTQPFCDPFKKQWWPSSVPIHSLLQMTISGNNATSVRQISEPFLTLLMRHSTSVLPTVLPPKRLCFCSLPWLSPQQSSPSLAWMWQSRPMAL